MYVRKFEADSLDEALQNIKKELGPDAIILKTITNKGLKGAFKKAKIEITAAISEKNYTKKAKVDNVLDDQQKDQFYQNRSSYISNMLNQAETRSTQAQQSSLNSSAPGYGSLGLNKNVSTVQSPNFENLGAVENNSNSSLDDFLGAGESSSLEEDIFAGDETPVIEEVKVAPTPVIQAPVATPESVVEYDELGSSGSPAAPSVSLEVVEAQKTKIDELERRLFELTQNVQSLNKPQALGIKELVSVLRSLDIEETYIQKLVKKANFEFTSEQLEDPDTVFEFALREMLGKINVSLPMFSSLDKDAQTVTVIISDVTCGQSSMLTKIASLKKDSTIIRNKGNEDFKDNNTFAEKFFEIDTKVCRSISEIVSTSRSTIESGKSVFIDYKAGNQEVNEVKKFIDGLKRSFENVEILICLSSINSELYNRKVLNRYAPIANGMVVTHLDQCLNFGALFNLAIDFDSLPYMFFGTGKVVPDDLESASAERILAGIFQL